MKTKEQEILTALVADTDKKPIEVKPRRRLGRRFGVVNYMGGANMAALSMRVKT